MESSLGRNVLLFLALGYTVALTLGSLVKPITLVEQPFRYMDKVMHLSAYCGLMLLWTLWLLLVKRLKLKASQPLPVRRIILITAILAVGYGIIIEVCQGLLTDYRTPDGWDILANTTGVLLAILVLRLFINNVELFKSKF